ncbi:MAG: carboxy-S-adenosyl-L-methionine synthase CmoA [Gammaproteobacteria bacterium]
MNFPSNNKDRLFADEQAPANFKFDARVAGVFEDMINRSVPGYSTIVDMIGTLAERYYQDQTRIYDLGCSLGAASFAIAQNLGGRGAQIVAVDNSAAMLEGLRDRLRQANLEDIHIDSCCQDINDTEIANASVVVLNFTLQFVDPAQRQQLLDRICQGMVPGGVLIISEKILFPDAQMNALFVDLHHRFKQAMGYSELEISRKRAALEQVLMPETIDSHRQRLLQAGIKTEDLWYQCFNFASMVAFK